MAGTRAKFLTLINSLATVFPDNNVGQITPAILRDFLDSMLRTCFIPDAFLLQTAPGLAVPLLANTWTVVPLAAWGASGQDASGDLTAAVGTGRLTGNPLIAGLDYIVIAECVLQGTVNAQLDIGFFINGIAPTAPATTITLQGAGRDIAATCGALLAAQPINTFWQLGLRAPGGALTPTLNRARFNLQLKNTWS